jgi:MFS transporter, putative metabolite:H+ symporter
MSTLHLSSAYVSGVRSAGATSGAEVLARLERLPLSPWHFKMRVIVGVATFFDAFDALTIAYVLPVIAPAWQLSPGQIGALISAGFMGQLFGAIALGAVAERFGRKPVLIASVLIFGMMSLACALAWSFQSLLVMRVLQGIGLGGEVPVAATYISEIAQSKNRGRFVLLFELVFPVGLTAAGLIGAWMVPTFGWQSMFYLGAAPALVAFAAAYFLPESPRWLAARQMNSEAEVAIRFIEDRVERSSGKALPPAVAGAVSVEYHAPSLSDLFGGRYLSRTLVLWTCWFATYLVNYSLATWLPSVYRTVFKMPLDLALRYGLITSIVGLAGATLCALLIDKVGRRPWFASSFTGASVALVTLWAIGPSTAERVLVAGSIAYFFVSSLSIGLYLYTPELYPTRNRALGVSVATAWLRIASIVGPTLIGFFVGGSGLPYVFLGFGIVALLAAIVMAAFGTETRGRILEELSP